MFCKKKSIISQHASLRTFYDPRIKATETVLNRSNKNNILTRYVHGGVFARPKLGDTHGGAQVSERVGERRPFKSRVWKSLATGNPRIWFIR